MHMIFRKTRLSIAAVATLFTAVASTAHAQLNFDDVTTNATGFNATAFTNYNGFTFENFGVLTSASTFGTGTNAVSPTKFAYAQADGSSFIYRTGALFNFSSAYLSFRKFDSNVNPLTLVVRGYRPGTVNATFERSVQVTNSAQFFSFQFGAIDELEFETVQFQAGGRSAVLALDDVGLSVVPEPASIALLAAGLIGIVVVVHSRKRRRV